MVEARFGFERCIRQDLHAEVPDPVIAHFRGNVRHDGIQPVGGGFELVAEFVNNAHEHGICEAVSEKDHIPRCQKPFESVVGVRFEAAVIQVPVMLLAENDAVGDA